MGWGSWLFFLLGNWYVWPFLAALVSAAVWPFVRAVRLWKAKRRFIRTQGAKLQNPQNADARFQLANLYAEGGRWTRALEYSRAAVQVARENPLFEGQVPYHFLVLLGHAHYHRGDYTRPSRPTRRRSPRNRTSGTRRPASVWGGPFTGLGELEKAFTTYNQSIEDNSSNLEGYFRLAQAATALGRREGGGPGEAGILAGGGAAAGVRGAPAVEVEAGLPLLSPDPGGAMKAVFLDRDGTIIVEKGYITAAEGVELLPGAAGAIARLRQGGWRVIVVSNQGCVARGMITEEELGAINFRMIAMLGAEGAQVDGVYCCPHHPDGVVPDYAIECDCRKPRPGLLERSARDHGLVLEQCVMIGDTLRDLEAGRAVGAKAVLVLTGKGPRAAAQDHQADHVAQDLAAAVDWLLSIPPAV